MMRSFCTTVVTVLSAVGLWLGSSQAASALVELLCDAAKALPTASLIYDRKILQHSWEVDRQKKLSNAEQELLDQISKDPDDVVANTEMAYFLLGQRRYKDALPYLLTVNRALGGDNADITLQIAYTYDELDREREALIYYKAAAASSDAEVQALATKKLKTKTGEWLAKAQGKTAQKEDTKLQADAEKSFTVLPDLERQQIMGYPALREYYKMRRECIDRAQEELERILEADPDNGAANLEIAYLHLNQQRYQEALPYLHKVDGLLGGTDPKIALQIAYTYDKLGEDDLTIDYFREAAEGDDPNISAQAQKELELRTRPWRARVREEEKPCPVDQEQAVTVTPDLEEQEAKGDSALNEFYELRRECRKASQSELQRILREDPDNKTAHLELAYMYLGQFKYRKALPHLLKVHELDEGKDPKLTLQIAYTYDIVGEEDLADEFYRAVAQSDDPEASAQAQKELDAKARPWRTRTRRKVAREAEAEVQVDEEEISTIAPDVEEKGGMAHPALNDYYLLRKECIANAYEELEKVIEADPDNTAAHLELAYLYLSHSRHREALPHLLKVDELSESKDPKIALQIAYTYDIIGEEERAIDYYQSAVQGDDPDVNKQAQRELDAKEGRVTEGEPVCEEPENLCLKYFQELYGEVVYLDRLCNWIFYITSRTGINLDPCGRHQAYVLLRMINDTESVAGATPIIFSDNHFLAAIGYRYRLVCDKHFFVYLTLGEAFDLTCEDDIDSRGDFRSGVVYYDNWEACCRLPFTSCCYRRVADLDIDVSYYSRYQYWIGYATWKEGFSLVNNACTEWNLYLRQFLAFDTKGEYFNNVYEIGPVLQITPLRYIPLKLYAGVVQGYYLRDDGPSINPNKWKYWDTRFYASFGIYF